MSTERLYSIEDLESLLDKIPCEIWLKDKDGKHIYINEHAAKTIGISKEEIIGKTDYEIRQLEIAVSCEETDNEVLTNKVPVYYEEKFLKEDQSVCYELYKCRLKKHETHETIIGCIAREVSAKNNAKVEMEKITLDNFKKNKNLSMRFIDNILNNLIETINCKNMNLFLVEKDCSALKLFSSAKTTSKDIFEVDQFISISDDLVVNSTLNQKNILDRLSKEIETYYKKDVIIENSISKVYLIEFAGMTLGVLHVYYDDRLNHIWSDDVFINDVCSKLSSIIGNISLIIEDKEEFNKYILENYVLKDEKKVLEESINLEKMKLNLLGNVSHEFRTPINIILTSTQLILSLIKNKNISEDKLVKYLNILRQNAYRLTRLVNNIIDVNKISAGFYELEMSNNNIVSIVEDIVLSTAIYVEEKGKRIVFDTEEEEIFVACDADKIEKIILNLISNSLKFVDVNGEIEVYIDVDKENEKVRIHVTNDGPAISKEDADKIFNRFVQNDDLLTRSSEGSGLGLFITKSLIEMHGGEIWVNTNNKDVTEFIFSIPIKTINSEEMVTEYFKEENTIIEKCNIEFSDVYHL